MLNSSMSAAFDNPSIGKAESAVTLILICAASAINHDNLLTPMILYGIKMSVKPAFAMTSASLTF